MILIVSQLIFIVFIIFISSTELIKVAINAEKDKMVCGSTAHSNQHIVYLLLIIIYSIVNFFSYSMFTSHYEYKSSECFILWVKVSFVNLIFTLLVNHFKQERLDNVGPINFKDIFKL